METRVPIGFNGKIISPLRNSQLGSAARNLYSMLAPPVNCFPPFRSECIKNAFGALHVSVNKTGNAKFETRNSKVFAGNLKFHEMLLNHLVQGSAQADYVMEVLRDGKVRGDSWMG